MDSMATATNNIIFKKHGWWGKVFAAVLAVLLLSGCSMSLSLFGDETPEPPASARGAEAVRTARSVIGVPYKWGGESPRTGFDCSGLTKWVYQRYGVGLPRSTKDQFGSGHRVSAKTMQPGDLVFFDVGGGNHVGIYSGNGFFIHSPKSGSRVREEDMRDYWWDRFIGARRVL